MNIYRVMEVASLFDESTYVPIDEVDKWGILQNTVTPETLTIQKEAKELLSVEALEVLNVLLESPQELEKLIVKGTGHKKLTLRKLKKFFRSQGLSWSTIKYVFAELRMYLIYLES